MSPTWRRHIGENRCQVVEKTPHVDRWRHLYKRVCSRIHAGLYKHMNDAQGSAPWQQGTSPLNCAKNFLDDVAAATITVNHTLPWKQQLSASALAKSLRRARAGAGCLCVSVAGIR